MDDLMKSDSRKENQAHFQAKKPGTTEVDILRKAYELILENSDLFFRELTDAFINHSNRRENMLT
jgi:hypothetical protein